MHLDVLLGEGLNYFKAVSQSTLKRKEIIVVHTACSACADFLFTLGQTAHGNYCLTSVQRVTLSPRGTGKLPPVLCSCTPAALHY